MNSRGNSSKSFIQNSLSNFGSNSGLGGIDNIGLKNLSRFTSNVNKTYQTQIQNIDQQFQGDVGFTEASFASRGIDIRSGAFNIALKNLERSRQTAYQSAQAMASSELDGAIATEKERSTARFNNNVDSLLGIGRGIIGVITSPLVSGIVGELTADKTPNTTTETSNTGTN